MSLIHAQTGSMVNCGGCIGQAQVLRYGPWLSLVWSEGQVWFRVIDRRLRFLLTSDARRADKVAIRRAIIATLKNS